jgi:DNA-3-methyladenine glycosylase II
MGTHEDRTTIIRHRIEPRGDFSLAAGLHFLSGFTPADHQHNGAGPAAEGPVLRLAFGIDGHPLSAGAALRQDASGAVTAEIEIGGGGDPPRSAIQAARAQVTRILSLDVDASGLTRALSGDPHAAALAASLRGLRPVCFNSPYEAAAWAVLSQRVQMAQAARMRTRIAAELGTSHLVAGARVHAFPRPEVLLSAGGLTGLVPEVKAHRLQAVAQAALDGLLAADRLRDLDADAAIAALLTIEGVGPFSAELTLVRGAGHPDHFPAHEKRLHQELATVYGIPADDPAAQAEVAQSWRPFRSWVSFYYRVQAGHSPAARPRSEDG